MAQLAVSSPATGIRRLIVLVASAGGLNAISRVLAVLPAELPAAVLVLQHLAPHGPGLLSSILDERTALAVRWAEQGERLRAGTVYVAPRDHHLVVRRGGTLGLTQAGKVWYARPSADVLLASAAAAFGEATVAVILTGRGQDGADGARAVRAAGGVVIAQDQATAEQFGMPGAATATGQVDQVLPLDRVGPALVALVQSDGSW